MRPTLPAMPRLSSPALKWPLNLPLTLLILSNLPTLTLYLAQQLYPQLWLYALYALLGITTVLPRPRAAAPFAFLVLALMTLIHPAADILNITVKLASSYSASMSLMLLLIAGVQLNLPPQPQTDKEA